VTQAEWLYLDCEHHGEHFPTVARVNILAFELVQCSEPPHLASAQGWSPTEHTTWQRTVRGARLQLGQFARKAPRQTETPRFHATDVVVIREVEREGASRRRNARQFVDGRPGTRDMDEHAPREEYRNSPSGKLSCVKSSRLVATFDARPAAVIRSTACCNMVCEMSTAQTRQPERCHSDAVDAWAAASIQHQIAFAGSHMPEHCFDCEMVHGVVDQEISQHRVAEGSADERCHHRVSQGRAPLSQTESAKESGHYRLRISGNGEQHDLETSTEQHGDFPQFSCAGLPSVARTSLSGF